MRVRRRIKRVTIPWHSPKQRTHNSYSRNSIVQPHTEPGRHAMSVLKSLNIPEEPRRLLERSVTEMDQELHDYHTHLSSPLSMTNATGLIETLPPAYAKAKLAPQEHDLVLLLHRNKGKVVSRDAILNQFYFDRNQRSCDDEAMPKIVDVRKCTAAQKLKRIKRILIKAGEPWRIETFYGRGFKLVM